MNRYAQQIPPRWWPPKLHPFWVWLWRPLRQRMQHREQQLMEVEVRQPGPLQAAMEAGQGILITPNHSGHADAHIMYNAADQAGCPFFFMTAWQVFAQRTRIGQWILQSHGCFSVDREGTDLTAFRQATQILQNRPYPLVIFPEGEVYHINERVTPFREGAATIALTAAKRAAREVVCIPCGIKYQYLDDPTDNLLALMDRLEEEIFWRPRPDLTLPQRIYRFAEGAMALKELEFLGHTATGPLPQRIDALADHILNEIEERYGIEPADPQRQIPERVKLLRRHALQQLAQLAAGDAGRKAFQHDLDDLFLVVQLFSYPGDYVQERPTIERMAETLDKFEEDVLGVYSAAIRGRRRATVVFGPPIPVPRDRKAKGAAAELTRQMEQEVQRLLDGM
ncbi:MAG: glycerol acyltransferase [Planctomycetales bacterium]|nr:glycerol acyltransferase [Planctomycetales bacterium]NIM07838.1 glycerol acyltransferase [Planctomycetales bacterium]NIN07330.1 glycerol acyltransferase [Planctomycetales bacterium]NIN76433.1 glycerol acyltransferase [Planctomycetales bacterium]NIO33631.1 glycerol acyltransferase [Planctomycetales bacterium]